MDKDGILAAAHFQPHAGKMFAVEGTLLQLLLREVEIAAAAGPFRAPFNLIFQGPPGDVLACGLYRLALEGEAFDLHLMPIHTPARDRQDYQAAFN